MRDFGALRSLFREVHIEGPLAEDQGQVTHDLDWREQIDETVP